MKNKPVFPFQIKLRNKEGEEPFKQDVCYGMTLREYYAGLAMQGVMANPKTSEEASCTSIEGLMIGCVAAADVLIAELEAENDR